ncbi:MAG: hypothetical protein IJS54_03575 [Desulfovibrio sp.]|nr:hypothetical protein [Desulfovibrio sp.]
METSFEDFMAAWTDDPMHIKEACLRFRDTLAQPDITISFLARPTISYSIRASHPNARAQNRDYIALVDVIDDDTPATRWLSVCMYADMVTDPEEQGDFVPQGLGGEDALCFTLDEENPKQCAYIAARLTEVVQAAKGA